MAHVAIIGAGLTGLGTALALVRDGHRVTIVERDGAPAPDTLTDPFSDWERPGVPQHRLPHGFVARGRNLLRDRLPEVLQAMRDADALDLDVADFIPGGRPAEIDDNLFGLFCPRPTLEWVLRRQVEAHRDVIFQAGFPVIGLVHQGGVVTGIGTAAGPIQADLVIDAGGRHSAPGAWFTEAGVAPPEERIAPVGKIYFSRYYRFEELDAAPATDSRFPLGPRGDLGYLGYVIHPQGHRLYSITLMIPTFDHELRALRHVEAFEAAVAAITHLEPWRAVAKPVSPVFAMGSLQNTLRIFRNGGRTLLPGYVAIGDARCHTDPALGWGASLGLHHGFALAALLSAIPFDRVALADAFDDAVDLEAADVHRVAAGLDNLQAWSWRGRPDEGRAELDPPALAFATLLAPASGLDPDVFIAVMRRVFLLDPVLGCVTDVQLLEKARRALTAAGALPAPPAGPQRAELLAQLGNNA